MVTSGGIQLRMAHVKIKNVVTAAMVDPSFSRARLLASRRLTRCLRSQASLMMVSINPPVPDAEDLLGLPAPPSTKGQRGMASASMTNVLRSNVGQLLEDRGTTIMTIFCVSFPRPMLGY